MRILIASRNTLIPAGLYHLLSAMSHEVTIQEHHSAEQLLSRCILDQIEALILDKTDHDVFTIEQLGFLKSRLPKVKIALVCPSEFKDFTHDSMQTGLNGYLSVSISEDELRECFRVMSDNGQYICHRVMAMIIPRIYRPVEQVGKTLTEREMQVAGLIAEGRTSKEIGDILNISPHTVQTHRKSMMKKLNISSAREVTLFVLDLKGSIPSEG
jgi:two-component system, NarL family, invasion response regulator UvrY